MRRKRSIQPKLLRFLETGEFRRVGGTNLLTVDVRVISATNKDLRQEVKAGRFREDLLYRLNVITLVVPLLKERREDIPVLAEYFLARKSRSRTVKRLSPDALQALMSYDWPGNVRELEHVLEGAVLLAAGETISASDLAIHAHRGGADVPDASGPVPDTSPVSLEEIERRHIEATLRRNDFNRARTADELGISKKTLYLKIKRYNLVS